MCTSPIFAALNAVNRRDSSCLEHQTGLANDTGLRRTLQAYGEYYLRSRTHLALDKDAPMSRPVADATEGAIVAVPQLGGLHHRYERRAA